MGISIQHNMAMLNASRQFNINTTKKAKSAEKLSSGYRINRAADDAAGLSISEKMRWMIRGLNQGSENAQDGVSWVQIGDGSLEETHAMLHRMTQLAIKASNETWTDADRAMMQVEFDHLQQEIDRLTDNTYFNEKHIFNEHESPYYQIEGATRWPEDMPHTVRNGENDLVVTYRQREEDPPKTAAITVPAGVYTTDELVDEIDTALEKAGLLKEGIVFEYSRLGTCNLNLEGGEKIDEVSGGLSYLLFDNYAGGTLGALIGTTVYADDDKAFIQVQTGINDHLEFTAISADGKTTKYIDYTLPQGKYTKKKLMSILQTELSAKGTNVVVDKHGSSIMLSSPDYIITEFKGNMFEIDSETRTGVFYDNVHHSNVKREPAVFTGGCILYDTEPPYDNGDPEKQVLHIEKGVNNLLVLNPNGDGEMTIDLTNVDGNGKSLDGCTMREAADALHDVLEPKGLNVGILTYPAIDGVYEKDINGVLRQVRYVGLEITSDVLGPDSKVGINETKSTAYATLFTSKETTVYRNDAEFGGNDTTVDENAYLNGLAKVNGLEIRTSGDKQNNQFWIQVSSDEKKVITLDGGTYQTANDLAKAIQEKLKPYYDENTIKVSGSGNSIQLKALKTDVTKIRVGAVDGNTGYRDIFQEKDIIPDDEGKFNQKNPQITLPEKAKVNADGSVYIDPRYSTLKVQIDGEWKKVEVAANNPSHIWASVKELEDHITKELRPTEEDIGCTLSLLQNGGSQKNEVKLQNADPGDEVSTPPVSVYQNRKGDTDTTLGQGGSLEYITNEPATVTFDKDLNIPITITNENKRFDFTLNRGSKTTIDLSTELGKTSFASAAEFKEALQKAINNKLNKTETDYGGIKVDLSGNTLVLKAGLMDPDGIEMSGEDDTSLSMDISEGSFIYDLHKTKIAASVELNGTAKGISGFNATSESQLKLTVTKPDGSSENINLDLKKSYGSSYAVISDLRNQLSGKNVTVSESGRGLQFVTTGDWKGKGYSITVDENSSAVKNLFGYHQGEDTSVPGAYEMTKNTPAKKRTNQKVQTGFTLSTGNEQKFRLTVDGTPHDATLTAKTYNTADEIAKEIQDQVNAAAGKDVIKVTADTNGRLVFETVSKSSASNIGLTYNTDSAMKKIFGTTPVAGAEASISSDGQLTLKRVGGTSETGSIYVVSHDKDDNYQGGSFIFEKGTDYTDPDPFDGYHSGAHSYMDGVDLELNGGKVDINRWNNELTFCYTDQYRGAGQTSSSQVHKIQITVPERQYTMKELESTLQAQLDQWKDTNGWSAKDHFTVSVTEKGVRIQAKNAGSKYRIFTRSESHYRDTNYRPSGSFYEKVLCSGGETTQALKAHNEDGWQGGNKVYAVGRQDVKNEEVKIQKDGNDSLSLEFKTPDQEYKLEMTLDPGYYKGDALAAQIQKQLDKALVDKGLPAGLIEAVVGIESTNVLGAIDDRALAFRLSDKVTVDKDGMYGIEAIGGTAAFSVFYATEGDIARAYIRGGRDISQGVEIREGANDFSVDVDGKTYQVNLTPGKYTAQELADHMTETFANLPEPAPLMAVVDEGRIKLMHTQYGRHKISNLRGSVKNRLFFSEKGEKAEDQIHLRLSSVSNDWTNIDRPWMNTMSLGINSLTISKHKYAQKAIGRLKEAVTKTSEVRSYFGAKQNQLESTIRNNENKAENTTAAESRIRDADFSREAVENSIHNILEQTGASIMAQAKQNAQLATQLLS